MFCGGAPRPYWTNLTDPTTLRACSARILCSICAPIPRRHVMVKTKGATILLWTRRRKAPTKCPTVVGSLAFLRRTRTALAIENRPCLEEGATLEEDRFDNRHDLAAVHSVFPFRGSLARPHPARRCDRDGAFAGCGERGPEPLV